MDFKQLESEADKIIGRYEEKRAAMLPLLWLVQEKFGYIPPEGEQWVGERIGVSIAHVREVVSFYTLYHTKPIGKHHIQVCTTLPCLLKGAKRVLAQLEERLGIGAGQTTPDGKVTLSTVECLCACEAAPATQINERYVGPLTPETLNQVLDHVLKTPETHDWLVDSARAELVEARANVRPSTGSGRTEFQPYVSTEGPVLSKRFRSAEGAWFDAYAADGGYQAAKQALTSTPAQVIETVLKSNLRGLGGAGFPTGKKWGFIPKDNPKPKFLVVNADEGEPGTFKDRYILERDPHALIEGMIIAAYAIGSHKAYIYIRGEYVRPAQRFAKAMEEARGKGWIGKNIQGSGFDLEIVIHRGAGAYICGEETALLTSLEGGKGFPKLKPPFPAISGLFKCPTIVNNVETLACVPPIIRNGPEWFAKLGTAKQGGTRLFSLCGHVVRPGLYEAPVAVTLKDLIFDSRYAGGVRAGKKLKAVIPGGISAKILTAEEINVAMDFDSLMAAGTMAGSAGVIVMDETTCIVQALWSASHFFKDESCGQCSPCREGTGWVFKIMDRILKGQGRPHDLDALLSVAGNMEGKTICVFADAAAWPVQSYIQKFRSEFEHHIATGRCELAVRGELVEPRTDRHPSTNSG
ncbi:MAG: NADH-quinone oxidoreductase subunit NuoF [Candidatus Omnitrophica bacterium]|nr:NADH-quinone oxidoreductase subunit NuoF [Candidatus Omnitrophota bacterium]